MKLEKKIEEDNVPSYSKNAFWYLGNGKPVWWILTPKIMRCRRRASGISSITALRTIRLDEGLGRGASSATQDMCSRNSALCLHKSPDFHWCSIERREINQIQWEDLSTKGFKSGTMCQGLFGWHSKMGWWKWQWQGALWEYPHRLNNGLQIQTMEFSIIITIGTWEGIERECIALSITITFSAY